MVLLLSAGLRSELSKIAAVGARLGRMPAADNPKLLDQRENFALDANNTVVVNARSQTRLAHVRPGPSRSGKQFRQDVGNKIHQAVSDHVGH